MRQVGTLPNERDAQRFAAYLVTQGATAHAESEDGTWVIWVRDENDIQRARAWFEEFRIDPTDKCYDGAEREAEAIRRRQRTERLETQKNLVDVRSRWQRPTAGQAPLTVTLVLLSVLVSLVGSFGKATQGIGAVAYRRLSFCEHKSYLKSRKNPLADVGEGQLWRAVTPIFLHMDLRHLIFNMIMFFLLGAPIEKLRGTGRFALLVLGTAVLSNVAQAVAPPDLGGTPFFGGMSGVVYGLFGYTWMKSLFDPGRGFLMPQMTVIILLGWMFLCMTGYMGNIANVAHVVGLIVGMAVGYFPKLWRT